MTKPTATELATALSFVLGKWKEAGAEPLEALPFDELLKRMDEPEGKSNQPAAGPVEMVMPPRREKHADYASIDHEDAKDPDWAVGTGDVGRG